MKTVIAGSRTISNESLIADAIKESGFTVTAVIEGGQRTWDEAKRHIIGGADWWARVWAIKNKVPVDTEDADWDTYGKAAGPIRNQVMALRGQQLIAVWNGRTRGTRDIIEQFIKAGKPYYVKRVDKQ